MRGGGRRETEISALIHRGFHVRLQVPHCVLQNILYNITQESRLHNGALKPVVKHETGNNSIEILEQFSH